MRCPFHPEFGKWIECPHLRSDKSVDIEIREGYCASRHHIAKVVNANESWCAKMIGKAMLIHKVFIGNDY